MNLGFDLLRASFFHLNGQAILLNQQGKIILSEGQKFVIPEDFQASVFTAFGFPNHLIAELENMQMGGPAIWRNNVQATFWGLSGRFDLGFQAVEAGILWLIVVRSLADDVRGEIWKPAEDATPPQPISKNKVTVLVAEDNPFNQKVTQRQLNRLGHICMLVGNGREAIDVLQKEAVDMILMDINMPEMDGYEACTYIRKQLPEPDRDIPVIAMSSSGLTASDPGFNAVLKKPVQEALLDQTIRQFTQAANATDQAAQSEYIRLAYLHEVTQSSPGLMVELMDIFLQEVPAALDLMGDYIREKQWRALRELAHKTKANFRYVGADQMFTLTDTIERYAASGSMVGQIPGLYASLQNLLPPTRDALSIARNKLAAE